jgi:N-acetylneuraminate synthase
MKEFEINERKVGGNNDCYIIAEIGNNHNGDFNKAIELINKAKEMGAHVAKFQMRDLNATYRNKTLQKSGDDLSAEYTIDLLNRFELSFEDHKKLAKHCSSTGIEYMCTPWDVNSIQKLLEIGVKAFKVASADLTNIPLIEALIKTNLPLILSTGMNTEEEIKITVDLLNSKKANFGILHCNSTYPAPFQSINLKFINRLKEIHSIVGYSGHERGIAVSISAVALGAKIIERHFTLDRNMEGPDHCASLEFDDFKALIEGIQQTEQALGTGNSKELSQGELINRENLAKSLIAKKPLKKGHIITEEDIDVKSPGQGLSPQYLTQLIGKELKRDVAIEEYFFKRDIDGCNVSARDYSFNRPWGVPVRYHDFKQFNELVKPDVWEFHLSYSDMTLELDDYFEGTYEEGFVVHAPELFEGSHLMDLATDDDDYRNYSIKETQKVINITRDLKKYFPNTKRPMIVANIGGFSMDENFSEDKKKKYYERFIESLKELDLEGVELIPQTMAPFPWHFGGQRYQNLFVHADEIAEMCEKNNLRMCFDVSHSKLTCNHFKIDFNEFAKTVAPYTAHLHLGDASGVDGEGLQVGDGEINFNQLANILNEKSAHSSFIPEIWQGHKNDGEGFWIALDKLESVF